MSMTPATHAEKVEGEYYSLIDIKKKDIIPVIHINYALKKYDKLVLNYGFEKYKDKFDSYYIKTQEQLENKIRIQLNFINSVFDKIKDFRPITFEEIYENCVSMKNINT